MELDWSTFLLEIVNFLILIWILKRFLYRPVLSAIAQRKAKIEALLDEAKAIREKADSLERLNETKLAEWEGRRDHLESELSAQIASKREKMYSELAAEIEKERSRQAALDAREIGLERLEMEKKAILLGASFTSKLLSRLSFPELEARLFDVFMEDLEKHDVSKMRSMPGTENHLAVSSAYPLPEEKRRLLSAKMESLLGRPLESSFSENPALLCGLRIGIGPWVLDANLKEELAYFRASFNED